MDCAQSVTRIPERSISINANQINVRTTKDYWSVVIADHANHIQEDKTKKLVYQMYVAHFRDFSLMVSVLTVSNILDHLKTGKHVFKLIAGSMKYY